MASRQRKIKKIGKIPKILHQIWIGPLPRPEKWLRTWREKHPKWRYILWDNDALLRTKWTNQAMIDRYAKKGLWHGVADIMRYEILYKHGGVMAGADSECLYPLDELFEDGFPNYAVDTSKKGGVKMDSKNRHSCAPLYACEKGSRFARRAIKMLFKMRKRKNLGLPAVTTGNRLMQNIRKRYKYRLKIWPIYTLLPEHLDGWKYKGRKRVYARHHWGSTLGCYADGLDP